MGPPRPLAPNVASGQVLLTLVVSASIPRTPLLAFEEQCDAYAEDATRQSQAGTALTVTLTGSTVAAIALTQTADVLEVALGETAPFTVVVKNSGAATLTNVWIHATLPAGMSYSKGSVTGADSVSVLGNVLSMHLTGSVAAGVSHNVHYQGGAGVGDGYDAPERGVRRRWPDAGALGQRDHLPAGPPGHADGRSRGDRQGCGSTRVTSGVQDAGEIGLVGLEVWTDDGEVATTDSAGRFSYHNVSPGGHGFRLDPASIPAGYRVADGGMVTVNATGWTTPRVDFRLLPTSGTVSAVRLPLAWSFKAHAIDSVIAIAVQSRPGAPGPAAPAHPAEHRIDYDVAIHNPYGASLTGLAVRFAEPLDSIDVLVGDSLVLRTSGSTLTLPAIAPHSQLVVRGWGGCPGDSTSAVLLRDGKLLDFAPSQRRRDGTPRSVALATSLDRVVSSDSIPPATDVPAGGSAQITLTPPVAGWLHEAAFPLPAGWDLVQEAIPGLPTATTVRDRNGGRVLVWHLASPRREPITLTLRPAGSTVLEPVRVAAERTEAARAAEKRREFLDGPAVQIFAPVDGAVLATDRVYIGVRGERGTAVELFDGDLLIKKGTTRVDGVIDFISIPLKAGSHRLRVRMQNSSANERWDSIAVHVSERPAAFALAPSKISLIADGTTVQNVRIRVLDLSGIPVVNHPLITVAATGVELRQLRRRPVVGRRTGPPRRRGLARPPPAATRPPGDARQTRAGDRQSARASTRWTCCRHRSRCCSRQWARSVSARVRRPSGR